MALLVGILAAVYFFQSDENKVKKQFKLLSEWVSKDPGEDTFTVARKTQNIGTLFAEKCRLETSVNSFSDSYTPQEISNLAVRGRFQFSKLSLRFYDLDVDFPQNQTARVNLTARLTGNLKTGELIDDPFEINCILSKIQNRWLFSDFTVIEVLKK